mmetsp:Transcript_17112/g.64828  ORF Transcript_17112/g.64828 Transcript_17112/m.64828 type:complete len:200 (-) Transcript_17112:1717-2316(-)
MAPQPARGLRPPRPRQAGRLPVGRAARSRAARSPRAWGAPGSRARGRFRRLTLRPTLTPPRPRGRPRRQSSPRGPSGRAAPPWPPPPRGGRHGSAATAACAASARQRCASPPSACGRESDGPRCRCSPTTTTATPPPASTPRWCCGAFRSARGGRPPGRRASSPLPTRASSGPATPCSRGGGTFLRCGTAAAAAGRPRS